jgi:hypothetical protein
LGTEVANPDHLLDDLELHLSAESETDEFLQQDADAVIARLCRALGLAHPAAAADRPADAPGADDAAAAAPGVGPTAAALHYSAARAAHRRWLSSA